MTRFGEFSLLRCNLKVFGNLKSLFSIWNGNSGKLFLTKTQKLPTLSCSVQRTKNETSQQRNAPDFPCNRKTRRPRRRCRRTPSSSGPSPDVTSTRPRGAATWPSTRRRASSPYRRTCNWLRTLWGRRSSLLQVQCDQIGLLFLKKMCQPRLLFHLFSVFSLKHFNFSTNQCEKCPSSIWCWDANPQPSDYESPPLTIRPGLQPTTFLKRLDDRFSKKYPKYFAIWLYRQTSL